MSCSKVSVSTSMLLLLLLLLLLLQTKVKKVNLKNGRKREYLAKLSDLSKSVDNHLECAAVKHGLQSWNIYLFFFHQIFGSRLNGGCWLLAVAMR